MIKTLSSYFLYIPFVSPLSGLTATEYTIQIYVWNGLKTDVPLTSSYTKTKKNPTNSTGTDKVNIGFLINDFIDFVPQISFENDLIPANNQVWVKTQVFYKTSSAIEYTTPQLVTTQLAIKGYGYGTETENAQPNLNRVLLSGTEFKVNREGHFVIPIIIQETIVPPPTPATLTLISVTKPLLTYVVDYEFTEDVIDIIYRYRLVGDTEWTLGLEILTESPFDISLELLAGDYEIQLTGFDVNSEVTIFSNILTISVL